MQTRSGGERARKGNKKRVSRVLMSGSALDASFVSRYTIGGGMCVVADYGPGREERR